MMKNFSTDRRKLLGTEVATILAPAAVSSTNAAPSANADRKLIQLCAIFAASRAEIEHNNRVGVPDDVCDRALDRWSDVLQEIKETPARTPEGIRAKAGAVRDAMSVYLLDGPGRTMMNSPGVEEEDLLGWSLVHDILGEEPDWG